MNEVKFIPTYSWCETSFRVSTVSPPEGADFTFCVGTGAMTLQTYATRDELRALGEMLLRHANDEGAA